MYGKFTALVNAKFRILIQFDWGFPMVLIDNKPLVQEMSLRRLVEKPLTVASTTQLTDTYMRHWASVC